MTIRILLLTQWFDPEPVTRGQVFARELFRQGFEVEVLTGFPNYPGGKVYPGYQIKLLQREIVDGVHITRVPLYPNHDQSAIRRVLNYMSFAASALFYGLFIAKRADVIYAYHPPPTVGITASLIRLFRRVPVVYDIQDMWPDSLRVSRMLTNKRTLDVIAILCQWVYRRVDCIVVLSPGFKKALVDKGVDEGKVKIIYNWCAEFTNEKCSSKVLTGFPSNEYFRIVFAGNMGIGQGLEAVLEAASLLLKCSSRVVFVFVGSGVQTDNLKQITLKQNLSNVIFLPRVPMSEIGVILRAADALLVHLKDDPLYSITIPSKTQAYMAAGKPILMAVPGDATELIERAKCGVIAMSEDPISIAAAATKMANFSVVEIAEMGQRAKDFYESTLSLRVGVDRFVSIFRKLGGQNNVGKADE